jgi:exopolysaccharide production protein ExoZ
LSGWQVKEIGPYSKNAGINIPRQSRPTITNVQLLRGVAALLVVANHLIERLVLRGSLPAEYLPFAWTLGLAGVQVFFVISGFIMVYTTGEHFGSCKSAAQFIFRRVLRIAPLYYIAIALYIPFVGLTKGQVPGVGDLVKSFLFIPYKNDNGLIQPFYALGWTLNYEMFFYLLFAAAMTLPLRIGLTLIVGILFSLAAANTFWPTLTSVSIVVEFFTNPIVLNFAAGIAIGIVQRSMPFGIVIPVPGLLNSAIAVGLIALSINQTGIIAALLIALAVGVCALLPSPSAPKSFTLVSEWLGDISYSLYLSHSFFLGVIAIVLVRFQLNALLMWPVYVVIAGVICALLAAVVHRRLEKPLYRWGRSFDRGRLPSLLRRL